MTSGQTNSVFAAELGHRLVKDFLDILILLLVESHPTWGYMIIKKTESQYGVKLRHGALYPMLNTLEARGLMRSKKQLEKGRVRKVYEITSEGRKMLDAYFEFINKQMSRKEAKSQG
jgi:DNA-binding PadR family transcriptional regulator